MHRHRCLRIREPARVLDRETHLVDRVGSARERDYRAHAPHRRRVVEPALEQRGIRLEDRESTIPVAHLGAHPHLHDVLPAHLGSEPEPLGEPKRFLVDVERLADVAPLEEDVAEIVEGARHERRIVRPRELDALLDFGPPLRETALEAGEAEVVQCEQLDLHHGETLRDSRRLPQQLHGFRSLLAEGEHAAQLCEDIRLRPRVGLAFDERGCTPRPRQRAVAALHPLIQAEGRLGLGRGCDVALLLQHV